jgi:hypothetical protein
VNLRQSVERMRQRQPLASRRALEATAADLRRELDQLRREHAAALAAIADELAELQAGLAGAEQVTARLEDRVATEACRARDDAAQATQSWGARLLDLEQRITALRPPPGGAQ